MRETYLKRSFVLVALFALMSVMVVVRVVYIQNKYENTVYYYVHETSYPPRGEIYDRNGHLLAGNEEVYQIGVDLPIIEGDTEKEDKIAMVMGVYFGMKQADFSRILTEAREAGLRYIALRTYVPSAEVKPFLEEFSEYRTDFPGLALTPIMKRAYPGKTLASNIFGFVNWDAQGLYGVEGAYDSLLTGAPVTNKVPRDPRKVEEFPSAPEKTMLVLTIDRSIQSAVEQILDSAVREYDAASGTIVVMNPQNGEILAMASSLGYPSPVARFDPNDVWSYAEVYGNKLGDYGFEGLNSAISKPYESGSVFKIFTMAAALDSGIVTPSSSYRDAGFYFIGNSADPIQNWDGNAWGEQDMIGCLQNSLNVCMAWLADSMGEDVYYDYLRHFGIGRLTNIDLDGEAAGRIPWPEDKDWQYEDLGWVAFGQGVQTTPIQLLMAASAIANKGNMASPHIVRSIVSKGRQNDTTPQIAGNPISAQTAVTLSEMLAIAMERGNSLALVDGYRIAGKTGTAQIYNADIGKYDADAINATFLGWGPVDDPQFMVYVWLEEPQKEEWASLMAAPVFRQVVEQLVVLMGIPPDAIRHQLAGQ